MTVPHDESRTVSVTRGRWLLVAAALLWRTPGSFCDFRCWVGFFLVVFVFFIMKNTNGGTGAALRSYEHPIFNYSRRE